MNELEIIANRKEAVEKFILDLEVELKSHLVSKFLLTTFTEGGTVNKYVLISFLKNENKFLVEEFYPVCKLDKHQGFDVFYVNYNNKIVSKVNSLLEIKNKFKNTRIWAVPQHYSIENLNSVKKESRNE